MDEGFQGEIDKILDYFDSPMDENYKGSIMSKGID